MLIKILLENNEKILINQDQVCAIQRDKNYAIITMSDGSKYTVKSPDFDSWENDIFVQ